MPMLTKAAHHNTDFHFVVNYRTCVVYMYVQLEDKIYIYPCVTLVKLDNTTHIVCYQRGHVINLCCMSHDLGIITEKTRGKILTWNETVRNMPIHR
jgi:hypothetical protein